MEGLEITILNKSELENQFTFGAEFYGKSFIRYVRKLKQSNYTSYNLKDLSNIITDGDHGAPNYQESGVLYLLSESVKSGFIDNNIHRFITPKLHKSLKRCALHPNDVVVTKTGIYFGKSAVIPEGFPESNTSAHVGKISVKTDLINPYYLSTFLNSSYGYSQLRRRGIKATRPEIKLIEFDDIKICIPSFDFQNQIQKCIIKGNQLIYEAQITYKKAETLLLETLCLKDFEPSKEPVNIKRFNESFGSSGRLDAEYYQKKYEQVIKRIKSTKYDLLSNLVKIKKSIEPGSDAYAGEGLPFIRVSDFNKFGLSGPDKKLSLSFYNENREKLNQLKPKKETILFSKDGSAGVAYMLRSDADFVTSSAILHLKVRGSKLIIPEYLTLVLNSTLVQMQAERDAGGSIIQHWRVGEIENVVVPIIDYTIQGKIAELVGESFLLKKQSEQLLELAKTAVEKAIEENEDSARNFIDINLKLLNL